MKRIILYSMVVIVFLSLVACAQPAGGIVKSEKPRVTSPEVPETDRSILVGDNSIFAFNLYQALGGETDNIFYSPYSISQALAMTYAGARSGTEQQMADTLHFTLTKDRLHPAFNSLDMELRKRGEGAKGKDGKDFRLNIVNALWGQTDFQFLPAFLDVLAQNYGAGLRTLDFASAPEKSRLAINKWVSDETEDRIEDLIPQGLIDTFTRLVLTNAIYFNAAWQHPFNEEATRDNPFYLLDGGEVSVPMMSQSESFGYAEGDNYQVVELPYDGSELSMVIFLPRSGQFKAFEKALTANEFKAIVSTLDRKQVNLAMPKYEFESAFQLKEVLALMGMPIAFSEAADFSGMTGGRDLHISDVVHKAFVSVDEAGTEAAAATAVIMQLTSVPAEPIEVTINRPFIFLIRDIETNNILFLGRVTDPGK